MEVSDHKVNSKLKEYGREIVAIIFWLFVFVKFAIFDIDTYILNTYAPELATYKLFFLPFILSVLWILIGKRRFPLLFLYVVFYPFLVLLWKIPIKTFKVFANNMSFAIIFSPAFFSILTRFRGFFISNSMLLVAIVCIVVSHNQIALSLSMAILLIVLTRHLYIRLMHAYRPTVFSKIKETILFVKEIISAKTYFTDLLNKKKENTDPKNSEKAEHSLLKQFYELNTSVKFFSEKVADISKSRKMELYLIISWCCTYVFTILIFSLEYYSLFKIDPKSFIAPFEPTFLSFLGFSFGKLATSNISEILPANIYATAFCYVQNACAIILLFILVFVILTAAREKYKEDIESIIAELNQIGNLLSDRAQEILNLTLSDIENILISTDPDFVNRFKIQKRLQQIPNLSLPTTDTGKNNTDKRNTTKSD